MAPCGGMERTKPCEQVADVKGPFLRFLQGRRSNVGSLIRR